MTLTITGAAYANGQGTAAILHTAERGAVAVSREDRPELWQRMLLWRNEGGIIAPFQPPADPAPGRSTLSAEIKLRNFLRGNRDVQEHLKSRGIGPADLGL